MPLLQRQSSFGTSNKDILAMAAEGAVPEDSDDAISDDAISDDAMSHNSNSSTVVHQQEPFDTIKFRILELCRAVLAPENSEISIERLYGGCSHRIIGVTITNEEDSACSRYVVRLPRNPSDDKNTERAVAPLKILENSAFPMPRLCKFDVTSLNALGRPYVILERIDGANYPSYFEHLPQERKLVVAKDFGKAIAELDSIRSDIAGTPGLSPTDGSLVVNTQDRSRDPVPYVNGPAKHTVVQMMLAYMCGEIMDFATDPYEQSFLFDHYRSLLPVVFQMSEVGLLDDSDYFCLCHLGIDCEAIFFTDSTLNDSESSIRILHSDRSIFGPPFMACSPPAWLWARENRYNFELFANSGALTAEMQEVKKCFDDAAGPVYRKYAYGAGYRLARQLYRLLFVDYSSRGVPVILREWPKVYESLKMAKEIEDPKVPAIETSINDHMQEDGLIIFE
ncbi:hypothetical protein N7456_002865 [Penicillium angulare]|uniref:Aminoglycoside phosphotransferase domain-containing protein n=1 Tax=Penicillium angulare TaxID=116970 RepID=A0A9W9FU85_9EURO|nr:hypothetical protein N7456_002865 [Penicillium angulare]